MSVVYLHYSNRKLYSLFLSFPGRRIPSDFITHQKNLLFPINILMLLTLNDCAAYNQAAEQPVSLVKSNFLSNLIWEVL